MINAASEFTACADKLITLTHDNISNFKNADDMINLTSKHIEESDYAARLFEVAMHSLMQAAVDSGALGEFELKPLSQMRSANKKHGNIGDIELVENEQIIESWDAKYGKSYLREEIEEACEKISNHDNVKIVGFVCSGEIERSHEIEKRLFEIRELFDVEMIILPYSEWVEGVFKMCEDSQFISCAELTQKWLLAYAESLAQRRRDRAPIDEPCLEWVRSLTSVIK